MKAHRSFSLSVLAILILVTAQACVPSTNNPATIPLAPESSTPPEPISPSPTLEPTAEEPAATMNLDGQIAYIEEGNVWRYILSTGESIQVTSQDWDGRSETPYGIPKFSPDGRYLAYGKSEYPEDIRYYITDLTDDTVTEITSYGEFIGWTGQGYDFFVKPRSPNFELFRYDLADLSAPVLLADFRDRAGWLNAISSDGQWISIGLPDETEYWHVPTASEISFPAGLSQVVVNFSPDSKELALSKNEMPPLVDSALYVAKTDLSSYKSIFAEPKTIVGSALWSPDGQWLAFTAYTDIAEAADSTDSQVMLVRPDGSELTTVEAGTVVLENWSPDGTKLLYRRLTPDPQSLMIYEISSGLKQQILLVDGSNNFFQSFDWGNLQQ